jgi:AAT family amino acid transporter
MAGWAVALGIGWFVLKARNPQITERHGEPEFEKVG